MSTRFALQDHRVHFNKTVWSFLEDLSNGVEAIYN